MRRKETSTVRTYLLDIRRELEQLASHDVDLGNNFDRFFNEMISNGFQWVGLRQLDFSKPCSCVTTSDGVTEPQNCTRCFKLGFAFTDYLASAYIWQSSMAFEFKSELGLITTQRNNMVLKHDRTVNQHDMVLILDTDSETGELRQPFKIMNQYLIQDVMPMRGRNGRVEFWKCSVEERGVDDSRPGPIGTNFKYGGNRSNGEPQ